MVGCGPENGAPLTVAACSRAQEFSCVRAHQMEVHVACGPWIHKKSQTHSERPERRAVFQRASRSGQLMPMRAQLFATCLASPRATLQVAGPGTIAQTGPGQERPNQPKRGAAGSPVDAIGHSARREPQRAAEPHGWGHPATHAFHTPAWYAQGGTKASSRNSTHRRPDLLLGDPRRQA
jgi:hypothetical protein